MPPLEKRQYYNRFADVMMHTSRYGFSGKARLARDCGLSKMAVIRLLSGKHNPSYRTVYLVIRALEKAAGRKLPFDELISYNGEYPTHSVCYLVGCAGCFPDYAYDDDGNLKVAYRGMKPGEWSIAPPIAKY